MRGLYDRAGGPTVGLTIHPDPPPLWVDEAGAVRVGDTRLLFVLVVRAFQEGLTAEEIALRYDGTELADVYGAVGYYLRHRAEVDRYLDEYEREAEAWRVKIEAMKKNMPDIRARILARRQTQAAEVGE